MINKNSTKSINLNILRINFEGLTIVVITKSLNRVCVNISNSNCSDIVNNRQCTYVSDC